MKTNKSIVTGVVDISSLIRTIRGQKVILDSDLARVFGVPTFRFNEAVKRNRQRFPDDFLFQLTPEEFQSLTSQFAMLKKGRGQHRKFLPYAFTENGAIMAANVLNSLEAVRMSVFVVRAFVQMRDLLGGTKELAKQLAALEKKLTARLDGHEVAIIEVLQRVMQILDPPPAKPASNYFPEFRFNTALAFSPWFSNVTPRFASSSAASGEVKAPALGSPGWPNTVDSIVCHFSFQT